MKKRMAVVTGGMGGLGEAICVKLCAGGDTLVAACCEERAMFEEYRCAESLAVDQAILRFASAAS